MAKWLRSVAESLWPYRLRTPEGPPGTLSCTLLNGAKNPRSTKRTVFGLDLTQRPGGDGESVGKGLLGARGWEKSTVTTVSKEASAVPGLGETEVIVSGPGGTVVVVDERCEPSLFEDPGLFAAVG